MAHRRCRVAHAAVGRVLSWALLVGFVGAAIAFIVWMNRARHNSEAITSDQRHRFRNVWVFVGWFIPIENFCIPYAVMQDIWRGSDRSQPMLGLQHRDTSGLVLLWWLCFLLPNFSISLPPKYVFELTVFATISAALSVAAAVLAARMIRELNAVQVSGPTASPAPAA
ncbi:DUF4328 domain-containing protein [Lentzea atacamensis]|uniref:DUF4328 domain-containing protein n=1 Tax=Lentzea atacamensis TaxID=531938 RepID=UPI002D783DAF|nr:DUF4328 domain-containing protein [Lentzea atacamensis]